mmetsp:Transcript_32489/g.44538  ORF Transcript_32489/g.44538 Transcript_32489/m.44538 type:complete len:1012 (+) Transcript_32489:40-3075(+)
MFADCRHTERTLDQISSKHFVSPNEKHAYAKIAKSARVRGNHSSFSKPSLSLKVPSKNSPRSTGKASPTNTKTWNVAKATLVRCNLLEYNNIISRGGRTKSVTKDLVNNLRIHMLKSVSFIEEVRSLHEVNVKDEEDILNLVADYLPKKFNFSTSPSETRLISLLQLDTKLSTIWTNIKALVRISSSNTGSNDNFNSMTSYCYSLSAYLIRNIIRSISMPDLVDMWTEIFNGFTNCGDAFSESASSKEVNNCTHLLLERILSLQVKACDIYRVNAQLILREVKKPISSSDVRSSRVFDWKALSELEQSAYGKNCPALQSFSKYIDSQSRDDVDKLKQVALETACSARLAWFETYRFFCNQERLSSQQNDSDSRDHTSESEVIHDEEKEDKRSFLINQMKSWVRAIISHDLEFWGQGLGIVLGSTLPRKDISRFPYCSVLDSKQRREVTITPESHHKSVSIKNVTLLRTMSPAQFVLIEATVDKSGDELQRSYCVANYFIVSIPFDDRHTEVLQKRVSELSNGKSISCKVKEWPGWRPKCKVEFSPLSIDTFYCVSDALKTLQWSFEPDYLRQCSLSRAKVLQQTDSIKTSLPYNLQDSKSGGIAAVDAWATCYLNHHLVQPVVVAVIDTGIFDFHADISRNMWSKTLTENDKKMYFYKTKCPLGTTLINGCGCDGTTYTTDYDGHGTLVSGVIGGDLRIGTDVAAGVAENVKLMACKATNDPSELLVSNIANCIAFARENGAQLINMSMEGCCFSQDEFEELRLCQKAGIIVVASAGNDGVDLEKRKVYPACYALDNVITVAASTKHNKLWKDSNYGKTEVDLSAPGENIRSTTNDHSGYLLGSGTSLAAPHVTAALAMLIQKYPKLSYQELIHKVKSTTDFLVIESRSNEHGRLNIHAASLSTPPPSHSQRMDLTVNNILEELENVKIQSVELIGKICELKEKAGRFPNFEKSQVEDLLRAAQVNIQNLVDQLNKQGNDCNIDVIVKELVNHTMEETELRARLDAKNLIS